MTEEPTSRKVVRNTLFNYLAILSVTVIRFVAMPILIHGLGNDRYGIYATVMGVLGYVGLLDLGIGISLTKFVAEYHARRDIRSLNEMLSTALLLYLGLGLVGAAVLVAAAGPLVHQVFHIPPLLREEARQAFWISAFSLFNGLTLGIFGNLLNGLQRQDIQRSITIGSTLVTYCGGILLVLLGYKLVAFMLFGTFTTLVSFLLQTWFAKRLLPSVRFLPRHFRRRRLGEIVQFSFAMFVNQLAVRNMGTLDKLVLSLFLPIGNVTLYAVSVTLTNFCYRIPAAAVMASLPAASELAAQERHEALRALILRGMKYTGLVALPVFTAVGVFAPDIVRLWMGEGYATSATILRLLLVGYFWLVLCASGMSVMVGIGRPYVNTFYALAQILIVTVLMVLLVRARGLVGAAAGASAAYAIGGGAYLVHSTRIFRIPFRRLVTPSILGTILLLCAPGLLLGFLHHEHPPAGLPGLLVQLCLYGLLYGWILVRYGIDAYDLEKISAVVPAVRVLSRLRR